MNKWILFLCQFFDIYLDEIKSLFIKSHFVKLKELFKSLGTYIGTRFINLRSVGLGKILLYFIVIWYIALCKKNLVTLVGPHAAAEIQSLHPETVDHKL
jgi:hypothetical protein